MLIDLTLPVTHELVDEMIVHPQKTFTGHIGTHIDTMTKTFPLSYCKRKGILFDVTGVGDRDIDYTDIDLTEIQPDMFVAFYSGFINREPYNTPKYSEEHPQLSDELIAILLDRRVSFIAFDFAGIRRPAEHHKNDVLCAENGSFVIENLCGLDRLAAHGKTFTAYVFPMNLEQTYTGLPCRILAEI